MYTKNILKNLNNQITIDKPWGKELIWSNSEKYIGKLLYINKMSSLSYQYHKIKEETIYVMSGILYLYIGDNKEVLVLKEGESYFIPPGLKHRFEAKEESVTLLEASTYHPKDVVRLEDKYDRK